MKQKEEVVSDLGVPGETPHAYGQLIVQRHIEGMRQLDHADAAVVVAYAEDLAGQRRTMLGDGGNDAATQDLSQHSVIIAS